MYHCAEALGRSGIECALFGFDDIPAGSLSTRCTNMAGCLSGASAVILPVPVSKDGVTLTAANIPIKLCDIFASIPKETLVFAGAVSDKVRALAEEYSIIITDYMEDEVLAEMNAYATAEGALMLMMQNSEKTVFGTKCLVSGYGRIGHYTAKLLASIGADVTVLARREISRAKAIADGNKAISQEELLQSVSEYDFIINTVPAEIFTEKELSNMSSCQNYIELASAPYGMNKRLADKYNIEIIDGSALPSRYCPCSAGGYIAGTLLKEFERSGLA